MKQANYGFDAPGVMKGLLAGGVGGVCTGFIAAWYFDGWLSVAGLLIATIALVFLLLGLSMLIYGLTGKMRMRDYMVGLVNWRGDEQVLDIGTGRGLMLIATAKMLRGGGRATGIDIWRAEDLSDNSLNRLAENVTLERVENQVTLLTEDARKLSFADASMDVVFSLYCIHNIEDKNEQRAALLEIVRVLKPGGRVLIAEWMPIGRYAEIFKEAGLNIKSNRSHFGTALTLMWMIEAEKPNPI
jgi:arsenite methyltransferase